MHKKRTRLLKISVLFVMVFVAAFMVMICGQAEAKKTWKVRMATYFGSDHAASVALREVFVPMVKEKTNGRVQVTVFDSCQLGAEVEFTEGVRAGIIEMAIFGNMLENTLPKLKILQQPFVFRGVDHLLKVLNGPLGKKLLGDFETVGVEPVSGFSQGEVHLGNNVRPIRTLEDCKGIRMRVWQGKSIIETVKALGIAPTAMALTEVYTALQQGIVDGVPNSILNYKNMGWADQIKYITKLSIMVFPNYYVANKKWFDGLPADVQKGIRDSAVASAEYTMKILNERETETERWFKDQYGIEIIQISETEKEPFKKATQVVLDDFCNKYSWARELLADINRVK